MGLGPVQLAAAPAAGCRSEPVRAETGARRDRFVSWLRRQKLQQREPGSQEPDPGSFPGYRVYIADIDNDGVDEYVLTDEDVPSANPNGFIRDVLLEIYRPNGNGWTKVDDPFDPLTEPFVDPVSRKDAPLLVRFCGKTYLTDQSGAAQNWFRETLIWRGGDDVQPVCDAAWIAEQRRYFQYIFDHQLYHDAQTFLGGVLSTCDKTADASSWMWMQSDLALTAYRIGRMRTCLAHVEAARARLRQAGAGGPLRRALDTNGALCSAALARPRAPYDFSWLRELRDHPNTPIVLDPRFAGLLLAIAPDAMIDNSELGLPDEALPDVVRMALWVPEEPRFYGDRYVMLSGWEPHNPGNAAMVWIDFATRQSVVYLRVGDVLASTTLDLASVPQTFWQQLGLTPGDAASYIGPDGKWRQTQVPEYPGSQR